MLGAIISLVVTVATILLSLAFQIAGKLRFTLPLLYFLIAVVSTFFTDWTTENEKLVVLGFFVVCGFSVLSWIISLIKVIIRKFQENAGMRALNKRIRQIKREKKKQLASGSF